MLIHSITVRNYRVIRELQVTLDPRLTLLGGPNESGKSTLIEAVHRALFLKAKTTGEAIKSMQSTRHVGAPEVEVGFEARGRNYRVSKKFTGANGSVLLAEERGTTWRGDEAETRLAELLGVETTSGGRGAGDRAAQQWAHLWVWQGQSGDDPTTHATRERSALLARLQGEGGAAAMQSDFDASVAEEVARQHAELFNQNGTPKKDSELGRAARDHEAATAELQAAAATLAKLHQAVVAAQEAQQTIAACEADNGRLNADLAQVTAKLSRVAALRDDERSQATSAQLADQAHQDLFKADQKIRTISGDMRIRTEALQPRRAETERLQAQEANAANQFRQTEVDYQAAIESTRRARLHQELAAAYVTLHERIAQQSLLLGRLNQVDAVRARVARLEAEVVRLPVISSSKLKQLQKLEGDRSNAEAALRAMAAGIEVLASDQTVQVGGRTLEIGDSHILLEDCDVAIGSAVRLRIKPGGGTSLLEARAAVQEARRALQELLDALGVSSMAAAAEAYATEQQLKADIKADKAQLVGLGADSIDQDCAGATNGRLAAEADVQQRTTLVSEFPTPANAAESQILKCDAVNQQREAEAEESRRKSARDAALHARQAASESLAAQLKSLQAEHDALTGLDAQLRLLVGMHGGDEARSGRLTELLAAASSAAHVLASTRKTLAELQPELLEQDHSRLQRALAQCQQTRHDATTQLAVARNTLQSDGATDPRADVAAAQAKAQSAKEQLDRASRRGKAVQLLHQLFNEEKHALAEQFTRPFAEKITGYLQCLFGASARAEVRLEGDKFCELRIIRPEQGPEATRFEDLSAGAREQMAAGVRLAMAEVLAKNHDGCLPVVFDDAFTNSDPERIEALQRMLDRAARHHLQVIVLSCTPSDYAALGAKTIQLRAEAATSS